MILVLDSPVIPGLAVQVGCGHLLRISAGEHERLILADPGAGYIEYLAPDESGLGCVREIDSLRASDPAGPRLNISPGAFSHDVVRLRWEQWQDFVEYCPLQGWLVSLDPHQIIEPALMDVFRCFMLRVGGVDSDER